MRTLLETDRLYLRYFDQQDGVHFFAMNNDPAVIKFTGDIPFKNLEEASDFITTYDAYRKTGIGRYAVIRKKDNVFLGWCGLKYHHKERVVDIGFRFYQKFWNQGYGTESAKAVIEYAFINLKYPFLVAHAHINNLASHKVLKKCGLRPIRQIDYDGMPAILYQIDNPNYDLRTISSQETWPVRHPVLRKGRPLEDVYMEADEKESTFHLGIFYKQEIVGVASFMEDKHPNCYGVQARLRGMAVLPDHRKKGLAARILNRGEHILKEKGTTLLWFNARIVALSFYKNLGYQTIGEEFNIPLVGPHYVMKKQLV